MIGLIIAARFAFSAWMVWDDPASMQSFLANSKALSTISIETQILTKSGELRRPSDYSPKAKNALLTAAHARKVEALALVANQDFAPEGVTLRIATSDSRHVHAVELASAALADGFAGVDLDYESLKGSDRDNFSAFVAELARECHRRKLKLAIALMSKSSEPGTWDGTISLDYKALGKSVDYARLMTYDEHWDTGDPGPVASIQWVTETATFAASQIAPEKLELGVPGYGYDWDTAKKGSTARSIGFNDFQALVAANAKPTRDSSGELNLAYGSHKVWFEDAVAIMAKADLVKKLHLRGFALWRLGSEDPKLWPLLSAARK